MYVTVHACKTGCLFADCLMQAAFSPHLHRGVGATAQCRGPWTSVVSTEWGQGVCGSCCMCCNGCECMCVAQAPTMSAISPEPQPSAPTGPQFVGVSTGSKGPSTVTHVTSSQMVLPSAPTMGAVEWCCWLLLLCGWQRCFVLHEVKSAPRGENACSHSQGRM